MPRTPRPSSRQRFYEIETGRRIDVFGNMAHVWSNYEARTSPDDASPERRGINSIQLFRDPDEGGGSSRMIWDNERWISRT